MELVQDSNITFNTPITLGARHPGVAAEMPAASYPLTNSAISTLSLVCVRTEALCIGASYAALFSVTLTMIYI